MSRGETAVLAAVALLCAPPLASVAIRRFPRDWRVENHRGRLVAPVLGLAWFVAVRLGELGRFPFGYPEPSTATTVWRVVDFSMLALLLVGLLDDRYGGRGRGFLAHLRSLLQLRPTTGAVKLVVGGGLAVGVALLLGGAPIRVAAAAILIALSTNLVNALDVRPGRALKWSLPILVISWILLAGEPLALLMGTALAAGVGILPFDLAEMGMLGDAGSNPLGFLAGVGLAATLPTWGVVVAAVVLIALQIVAETVTISRVIEAVPPLRWFDRLGRRS